MLPSCYTSLRIGVESFTNKLTESETGGEEMQPKNWCYSLKVFPGHIFCNSISTPQYLWRSDNITLSNNKNTPKSLI